MVISSLLYLLIKIPIGDQRVLINTYDLNEYPSCLEATAFDQLVSRKLCTSNPRNLHRALWHRVGVRDRQMLLC
jgi:hypothetical protein